MKEETILKNVSKHIVLDDRERGYFFSLLHYRSLKKGEILLKYGEVCKYNYFVISGCLRNYSVDEYGTEHIIAFAPADWWTSDLYSYLTGAPAENMIDALIATELFEIRKQDMEELFIRVPKFERFFRILFQNAMINNLQRLKQVLSIPAEERYIYFMKQYPFIFNQIPLKYIASYLGISPEFLSKIRNKLAHT